MTTWHPQQGWHHGHGHERRHPNLHGRSGNGSLLKQAALPPELEINRKEENRYEMKGNEAKRSHTIRSTEKKSTRADRAVSPYLMPRFFPNVRPPLILSCLFRALTVASGQVRPWRGMAKRAVCCTASTVYSNNLREVSSKSEGHSASDARSPKGVHDSRNSIAEVACPSHGA
jgi:hypothetical protein